MSTGPTELVDAHRLAARGACVERRYRLSEFPRLADLLAAPEGEAEARLRWQEVDGVPCCELEVEADAPLTCQRCGKAVRQRLTGGSRLALTGADEARVPSGYESLPVDPARLDLLALVEDELLLSLPVLTLHGADHACGVAAAAEAGRQAPAELDVQRPFAGLKDLLKH